MAKRRQEYKARAKPPSKQRSTMGSKMLKIIEIPSEIGGACRGAGLGSEAIKIAALNAGSSFFNDHATFRMPDRNYVFSVKDKKPAEEKAKWIKYILENCQGICNTVSDVLEANEFPLIISGDHSSAAGVIAGIKQAYPTERLGIIWIDAHSDLHSPYTTYSGNMHGMPLGASLALDGQAKLLLNKAPNLLPENVRKQWDHLKELGGISPKVLPEDIALIGVRYFKEEHATIIKDLEIPLYSVAGLREKGVDRLATDVLEQVKNCDRLFISFDVDSLDCDKVSRGTGTPEPNGLYTEEAIALISILMANPKVCCLEITEVNPLLDDKGNAMAEAAWKVIDNGINVLNKQETHEK